MYNLLKVTLSLCLVLSMSTLLCIEVVSADETTVLEISPNSDSPLQAPATIRSPISTLQFHPQVDIQSRNMLEAQGDVSVRGGIFENTGFSLGAATLIDPQTGHYFSEIPVSPYMLSAPQVQTGVENTLQGFNSSVATIQYNFVPISDRTLLRLGIGDSRTRVSQLYLARSNIVGSHSNHELNFDAEAGYSISDGTRSDGEHEVERFSGRLQLKGDTYQTDLIIGYQDKYYQWPYLYAVRELHELVGSSGIESDELQTKLLMLHHQQQFGASSYLQAALYYRENDDDYEFDITQPGLFNPYEHETRVVGAALKGATYFTSADIRYGVDVLADEIKSTALVFGDFDSRTYVKAFVAPSLFTDISDDYTLRATTGLSYDYSNRNGDSYSPVGRLALTSRGVAMLKEVYAEYSRTTQLPGYTALSSNPDGGLFRGNKELRREISQNYEIGVDLEHDSLEVHSALFFRKDGDLVDWTYSSGAPSFAARFANNIDVDVRGAEVFARYFATAKHQLGLGYTYLLKDGSYEQEVDASFYALNYPKHRIVAALESALTEEFKLQWNQEYRWQVANSLRESSSEFFLSSAALIWRPGASDGVTITALVENIFDREFDEVPGVPGRGRLVSLYGTLDF